MSDSKLKLNTTQEEAIAIAKNIRSTLKEDDCGKREAAITGLIEYVVAVGGAKAITAIEDEENAKWAPWWERFKAVRDGVFDTKLDNSLRLIKELDDEMIQAEMYTDESRTHNQLVRMAGSSNRGTLFTRMSEFSFPAISDYEAKRILTTRIREQTQLTKKKVVEVDTCC